MFQGCFGMGFGAGLLRGVFAIEVVCITVVVLCFTKRLNHIYSTIFVVFFCVKNEFV